MPQAYAEASDHGRLPAPARQIAYAVRRLAGLGDELRMDYLLKGAHQGAINWYLETHEAETADWDVIRDARGELREPHTYRSVPLGTVEVRRYLSRDGVDNDDDDVVVPQLSLLWQTNGPRDRYGSVLYIEKEGFAEQLRADNISKRFDLAVMSSKGYSVRAARLALRTMARRNDVRVIVAHDFDQQGIGIYDLIHREIPGAVDLGLRLEDIEDDRWDLAGHSESVTYSKGDPLRNLAIRGATVKEMAFLRDPVKTATVKGKVRRVGRRVELNALPGRRFIEWLEAGLAKVGVEELIPDDDRLAEAYRRAYQRARFNQWVREAAEDAPEADAVGVPPRPPIPGSRCVRERRRRPSVGRRDRRSRRAAGR
jgi:hypothetical protein